ncbi:MAG: ROK family transcriptional regulator [Calditrichaeota bacterium]|nr:MAG: ROK family transcriptional regulator [Calditrichota bacterium]
MECYLRTLRGINEIRVVRALCEEGALSRAALANMLNLSRAALTIITQKLADKNLILEVGKGTSTDRGGRREVLLSVNQRAGIILSIELEVEYAQFAMMDINAAFIDRGRITYAKETPIEKILDEIILKLKAFIEKENIYEKHIIGVGICLPGILDYDKGTLRESYTLGRWQDFRLREYIENNLNLPTFIENDVKALTLGEFQFGAGKNVTDLVCLWIGDGIGAGIIVNNQLLHGSTSSAGEIGYNEDKLLLLKEDALLVNDADKNWGQILTLNNLRSAVRRGKEQGWQTELEMNATIEQIIEAAEANDPLALHLFKLFGKILGSVCSNLIYTLNPPLVILSGALFEESTIVVDEIRQYVAKGILRTPIESVSIKSAKLGEEAMLLGAAALVLDDLFHFPVYH